MTLRARINLVASLIILLVAIVLIVTGRMSQNEADGRFREATISSKEVLWKKISNSQLDQMQASISSLSRDRETIKSIVAGDPKVVEENAVGTYNRLSVSEVLSRLQLVNREGEVLFSKPNEFSGKTQKLLVKEALASSKIMRGLERDDDGKLILSVVFPLYMRGAQIGVGVIAKDLQTAIDDFKINDEAEIAIFNKMGNAEYTTNAEFIDSLNIALPEFGLRSFSSNELKDKIYTAVAQPISDINRNPLAHLVSVNDHTESYNNQYFINNAAYIGVISVLIISIFGLYFYIKRSFNPLNEAIDVINRIASGDLSQTIDADDKDETGKLLVSMRVMNDRLNKIVSEVLISAKSIDVASRNIKESHVSLSQNTQHQASSLEETASSMEEMTSILKQSADNAAQAKDMANDARAQAKDGEAVAMVANKAMSAISESSQKISEITNVIDGIAFQTNLLSINAAIEAAQAGEYGRGFAVVAQEVRALAQSSANAAKEIKELIKKSLDRVEEGSRMVDKTNQTLKKMVESVTSVSDMVSEIASASKEQASGISQVNSAVTDIDQMLQQNAAVVEETTTASESLYLLSEQLVELMDYFKLDMSDQVSNPSIVDADPSPSGEKVGVVTFPYKKQVAS